ncbi:MAG: carboxymuconolactone decarboxylase family protein [Planctomycetia bacterium]|nr:carboxymuconolactone decarboxylase family protein [Planctomycetia bacterium]
MSENNFAHEYCDKLFPGYTWSFQETDPEFNELFKNFAYDQVVNMPLGQGQEPLDDRTRFIAILAVLLGCQGLYAFQSNLMAALNIGVTPIEVKEIVYQSTAYLGIGRVLPFLKATNAILESRGVSLPLEPQGTTTSETRLEAGAKAQVDIFGEGMRNFWNSDPEETRHIRYWLASNCFGDYYTRNGLDLKTRELITFCFLSALGGCEPQLTGHVVGNLMIGNSKALLIQVLSQCVPYIGYPRTLNALTCIQNGFDQFEKQSKN